LSIAVSTAEKHIERILKKLEVHRKEQLPARLLYTVLE
jgi:DNA-binding CsgD family transcriptional regulator